MKSNKKKKLLITIPVSLVVALCIIFFVYVNDYYPASLEVDEYISSQHCGYVLAEGTDDGIIFVPEEAKAGLIFYPGGKVEYTAYAPLLESLAEEGVMCFLMKMPFNLAVFNQNAANGIIEEYPEITEWYMCGHSLGGAMAAAYLSKNMDKYDGIVLLGAYAANDISDNGMKALLIYGSNDEVLNREKFEEEKSNLPIESEIIEIKGGCHALFGNYGAQEGDGEPTITWQEQQQITKDAIINFIY